MPSAESHDTINHWPSPIVDFDLIVFTAATGLDSENPMNQVRIPLYEALAQRLRGRGNVLVVTHYVSWAPELLTSPRRLIHRLCASGLRPLKENLWVYSPLVPVKLAAVANCGPLTRVVRAMLSGQLENVCQRIRCTGRLRVVSVNDPFHAALLGLLGESLCVYDCLDDYALYGGVTEPNPETVRREEDLARHADLVFTTSRHLFEKMKYLNPHTVLSPNAVEFDFFHHAVCESVRPAPTIESIRRPIVGFMGNLTHWYDFDLFRAVVRARPDWSFVFIGWVTPYPSCANAIRELRQLPNTHFLGPQDFDDLPRFLKGFDVAILPYQASGAGASVNPDKMYQYMAAGVPVVGTPTPEIARFADVIEIAGETGSFIQAIERCLSGNNRRRIERQVEIARHETWGHRAGRQLAIVEEHLERKARGKVDT